MNSQEFERKMNFIMDQQAQFEQRHRVWKVEIEDILTRLARVTNEGFKDVNAKMNALIDAQIRTEEQVRLTAEEQRKTDEQLRLTAEAQRKTEEGLRKTDELLRRYLRTKFNGGSNN